MTTGPLTDQAFADQPGRTARAALEHAAHQLTAEWSAQHSTDLMVLALDPDSDERRVLSSAGNSAIRAAVSVAIAAGNTRAWSGAKDDTIVAVDLLTLPEIIRAAVLPAGIASVDVASVEGEGRTSCLAMWLAAQQASPEDLVARRAVLERLHQAAEVDQRQAEAATERAARRAADRRAEVVEVVDVLRTILDRTAFISALGELSSEEAGVLAITIDDFDAYPDPEGVARTVAERIGAGLRRGDLVARTAADCFAVLLIGIDRHAAFEVSKRVRATLAEPVNQVDGASVLSLSIGLSHEVGLIDPDELFASAESAMREARQAGGARMLVAS
jgi:diguanylate cyclase (GGDEF)-like protein